MVGTVPNLQLLVAMGQKPVPPVNIPIQPLKNTKMGGAPKTPKWDAKTVLTHSHPGFEQVNRSHGRAKAHPKRGDLGMHLGASDAQRSMRETRRKSLIDIQPPSIQGSLILP